MSDDWKDLLLFEKLLTPKQKKLRDTVRIFAENKLRPNVAEAYQTENFDPKILKEMGKIGILGGITGGGSHIDYGLAAYEIERVDSGYRSALSIQSSLVMYPIHKYGTPEVKKKYMGGLQKGTIIGAFGLTEENHGSDPDGMETRARKNNDGSWALEGSKYWIGNATIADIIIVWAKDQNGIVHGFIVERQSKGVTIERINGKLSLRTIPSCKVTLRDVVVPQTHHLQVIGLKGPLSCLNKARYGIAWGVLGAAEDCWHYARAYTLTRKQFRKPLAANQLIQYKLAEMQTEIAIALQATYRLGQLMDEDSCSPAAISLLKRNNTRKALEIARTARDMLGGNGILIENHIMRHMCNLESVLTYEGTQDIHALILGRSQTGINAF